MMPMTDFTQMNRNGWRYSATQSRKWDWFERCRSSHCQSARTNILERTSIRGHMDGRVRPATTTGAVTEQAHGGGGGKDKNGASVGVWW
uniref:Uncharacterized protein n=1 Tax=Romanomermis culicivorax TaxID=13658 RepID=A0A915L9N6_ROMCU